MQAGVIGHDGMVAEGVDVHDLPPELSDRVRAATANADYRRVHRAGDGTVVVYAQSGDQVAVMELAVRPDGSVSERTITFKLSDVVQVTVRGSEGEVEVDAEGRRQRIPVPAELATRLNS